MADRSVSGESDVLPDEIFGCWAKSLFPQQGSRHGSNASSKHLKVVILKAQLIDAEGVEIESNENSQEIPAESFVLYNNNFYSAKAAQLEGAKAIMSLKAMIPVASFDARETTEIGKE